MYRNVLLLTLVCLAYLCLAPASQAGKRPVADLIADLKKGDNEKFKALQELADLGDKAAEAVPALMDLLSTKNEDVRLGATLALGKIGKSAVEPLTKAVASDDSGIRFYAVWGLAFIGPSAKSATPAVLKALSDKAPDVRRKAAYALGMIDAEPEAVVGPLVTALGDSDADVRQTAAASLPKMSKIAVPILLKAVKGEKGELRLMAIKILGDIGSAAAVAIPELKTIYLKGDETSAAAADALAGMGAASLPVFVLGANDDNIAVRGLAVRSLQRIGAPAVPSLVDLLGAKHVEVRRQVAAMLGGMQVNDKMVVIGLGFATKDKDHQVRLSALHSIQQMGSAAKLAEPYVVAALSDIDPNIRQTAFHTLSSLGIDPRPGLKKALSHPELEVRIKTASLMSSLNLEVDLAVPVLLEGIKHKDPALKMQAAHALALRGLEEDAVLPIFIDGLKNEVASVRRQAAETIARYGAKGRKAAPALIAALDDPDDSVSGQALATLRGVGEDPKSLFAAVLKVLRRKETNLHPAAAQIVFQVGPEIPGEIIAILKKDDAPGVRLACLQVLAMVGPQAKDGIDELIKALDDPAARTRMTAARGLGNIGPDAKSALEALAKVESKDADANVRQIARAAQMQIKADPMRKIFEVQGVLTTADPLDRVRGGCHHVVHTYYMKAGQTYTLNLNSQWDNYLRLETAQGVQVAQDDDSGGFPNAKIVYAAPKDGWYRIIVTSFGGGASGNYTLKVQ